MNPIRILPVCVALSMAVMVSPALQAQSADQWGVPVMPTPGAVIGGAAPIENALARIIPAPYRIELDSAVPSSVVLVWRGGNDWMTILRQAVAPLGLIVDAEWQTNTIRVVKKPAPAQYAAPIPYASAPSQAITMPAATGDSPVAEAGVPARPIAAVPNRVLPASKAAPDRLARTDAASSAVPLVAKPAASPAAHVAVVSTADVPQSSTATGRAFTVAAGEHLSEGLTQYARTFGWRMRWQLAKDYILDAPLPIPAMSLKDGLRYVLQTYQSQGGLRGATFVLAEPNHIVVARPTAAMEDNQ